MPRFFIHIENGRLCRDPEGSELPSVESARDQALEAARDLIRDGARIGIDRRKWFAQIEDESGQTVIIVPFSDALRND